MILAGTRQKGENVVGKGWRESSNVLLIDGDVAVEVGWLVGCLVD